MNCKLSLIFSHLENYYNLIDWWSEFSAFEIMVSAILTQNTSWNNANKALTQLQRILTPEQLFELPADYIAKKIRPSGFYNQKARTIRSLCLWFQKYDFSVEKVRLVDGKILRQQLLSIKGIGNETADSILNYALHKLFFVIDNYTKRILMRVGYNVPKSYNKLSLMITGNIPKDVDIYKKYHGLFVEHAKLFCKKIPQCINCPIIKICNSSENVC